MKRLTKDQKYSNRLFKINEDEDGCKKLINNSLTERDFHAENKAVNKMLSVLIFLMVR